MRPLLLLALTTLLCGCSRNDTSIVMDEPFGNIENGTAYEQGSIDATAISTLVVPHQAVVRRRVKSSVIQIAVGKRLSFAGHPPKVMSIRDARHIMGCALKRDGDTALIGTYGEWSSIEGGSSMRLVITVPDALSVEQRQGLSGEKSECQQWSGGFLSKPDDSEGGWWYGPATPSGEWAAIRLLADPTHAAAAPPTSP